MEEFNNIQNLWKKSETEVPSQNIDYKKIKNNRQKLKSNNVNGAVLLLLTGIFIFGLMIFLDEKVRTPLVIVAMCTVSAICFLQAGLCFFNANKISRIKETQSPNLHLKQWQDFRIFQKKQRHWNLPLYYILLGVAMGFYLWEILKNADFTLKVIAFGGTYSWMIFSYFYLGKKQIKKQDAKMDEIITNLKNLENQFQ